MVPVLLVDGHSVIFAWPELREKHAGRTGYARDELVRALRGFADASGWRVAVVFDGRGEKVGQEELDGVQIFYSATGQTADSVIERLVCQYATIREVTVATDDGAEQTTVDAFGGRWISTDGLRDLLQQTRSDFERDLKRYRR
jgi:predicted RNA-binding protein with PIN domain